MAANSPNYIPGAAWVDLYAVGGYGALASQKVTVQSIGFGAVKLYAGGAGQPADSAQGFTLANGESWTGTTDHLWVRSSYSAVLAVGKED